MVLGKLPSHVQKTETGPLSYTLYKSYSWWIKDLNVRSKTIKILEEKPGNTIQDIGMGKDFLTKTPKVMTTKAKTDERDLTKLKRFCRPVPWLTPVIPALWEAEAGRSGWGRKIAWTWEVEVAVSGDCIIAVQPGQQEWNAISKKKKTLSWSWKRKESEKLP